MPEVVQTLTEADALEMAERQGGRAIDVAKRFAADGKLVLYRFTQDECDVFLDIAWQELATKTKYLTEGSTRTLRLVARIIIERFGSFANLANSEPQPGLEPEWFRGCAEIEEEGFDWSKWPPPWLAYAVPEDHGSETTSWYVWEGVHSIIVLAVGLVLGTVDWQPLEAVVCLERP